MYKVIKEQGQKTSIIIENTDTNAIINIGQIKLDILNTLKDNGYTAPLAYRDAWNIEVNKETANALAKLALRMKKPIRNQSKKVKDLFEKSNKEIDAMDVLLGLAQYS